MIAYFNQLEAILVSKEFRDRLEQINDNFPNLKQEHLIRDVILSVYNQQNTPNYRAFSEHPRKWKLSNGEKKGRVDLSFNHINELECPYKIEIKFYFTGDIKGGRENSVTYNYLEKECDLLMIIVQDFMDLDTKKTFDKTWGIDSKLYKYQLKEHSDSEEDKFKDLEESFKDGIKMRKGKVLERISIEVDKPYKTRYTFCFLERI